jgi:hypothetical protein
MRLLHQVLSEAFAEWEIAHACTPHYTSAAWLKPSGEWVSLGGEVHNEWAERYLRGKHADGEAYRKHGGPADAFLYLQGWARVTNAYNIRFGRNPTEAQIATAVDMVIRCPKARKIDPMTYRMRVEGLGRRSDLTIDEFVHMYGTKEQREALYADLV